MIQFENSKYVDNSSRAFLIAFRNLVQRKPELTRDLRIARQCHVYVSGQPDSNIYYIVCGQVKLVYFTPDGRECGLSIRATGDIFGELCLCGHGTRIETAVVMQDAHLKALSVQSFLRILRNESLLEDLVRHLAQCMALEQEHVALLLSANSEILLVNMLIHLGKVVGTHDSQGKTIVPRILLEDLAAMVGTTRSRVGFFLKRFKEQNLVDVNANRSLIFDAEKLRQFATGSSFAQNAKNEFSKRSYPQISSFDGL
jgi:CRP/FNR family transcriptional regulator, cyclic AMP receptor protein